MASVESELVRKLIWCKIIIFLIKSLNSTLLPMQPTDTGTFCFRWQCVTQLALNKA